jgi:hypothetical protein
MAAVSEAATSAATDRYITGADCLRRYPKLSRTALYRCVVGGGIHVILPPGKSPRYNVADLDRAMAEQGG